MGQRYEKNRNSVSENRETRRRIGEEGRILSEEFASLQELSGMIDSLDDDIVDSVRELETVQVTETERLVSEQEEADAEKEKITADINAEIDKLDAGVSKLDQLRSFEFGQKSVNAAEKTYRTEISKFKELLDELEDSSDTKGDSSTETSSDSMESFETVSDSDTNWVEGNTVQVPHSNNLAPTRSTPRDLPATEFGFTDDGNGNMVYDSPLEMSEYLYKNQGSADPAYQGTCGLCSCANILRLSGVNYSEKDILDYAKTQRGLIDYHIFSPSASGATSPESRKEILEHFGISSGVFPIKMDSYGVATQESIDEIANHIAEGRGVILSVHAGELYYARPFKSDYHAVIVTSVVKNKFGDVAGFYIADSNPGRGTKFYTALQIQNALTGNGMNVTYSHIR